MEDSELRRAVAVAKTTAEALALTAADAIVLQHSNRLVVRLLPSDVVARVTRVAKRAVAEHEVAIARRLVEVGSPVATLDPRVEPRVEVGDEFVVSMWTYYEPTSDAVLRPRAFARALEQLHSGLRQLDLPSPHYTDRVAEAQQLVASEGDTPDLGDRDREMLRSTLRDLRRSIGDRGAAEQLLHGEPHPGNVLNTRHGPRFVDFETVCTGPVEFEIAHVPAIVAARFSALDQELLSDCRALVLAMVAAWRWDGADDFPDGRGAGRALLDGLRAGPPWPTLDAVWP